MNWFQQLFGRRKIYGDLSEEIRQHLVEKTDALVAKGMSRADAELTARREFGNVTGIEEQGREAWLVPFIDSLYADSKYAFRQLRKNFGFTLTAIVTLALGIGATTAIFSLVNTVLLQPLPFPAPERLVWMSQQDHSLPGVQPETLSYPDFFDWRASQHSFDGIAAYAGTTVTLVTQREPRHLDAAVVSSEFFRVLGTAPMIGRDLRPEDEKAGNRAVMLSYSLWQSAFGSAPDIASRTIRLGDQDYAVAGVMPKNFEFPINSPATTMWISVAHDAEGKDPKTGQRGFENLEVIGRLKSGATVEQAKADLSLIAANVARQNPDSNKWYTSALVEPELEHLTGDTRPALRILFGSVMLVLLMACANVAGLLLARGSRRGAEFALRASLGASRAVIVRQLLVESVALSFCGGIAGIVLAYGLLRGMVTLVPLDIPRMASTSIDGTVLAFVVLVSIITGLLFGVLPALRMSQQSRPGQLMREGSRTVAGGRGEHRIHNVLVVAQTAIGLVLLVGSGLLIRSFVHILNVNPGFDANHVLTARVDVSFNKLNHDQHVQFYNRLIERLAVMPGIESVSAGWPLPMSDSNASVSFSIEGRNTAKGDRPNESAGVVLPGYFKTMRIPLISGRAFGERDTTHAPPVMIVNQAFARKYFPHEDPLGKHIQVGLGDGVIDHPMREVVGIVGDIKRRGLTAADPEPQYYLPFSQALITNPYLTIRTTGDPSALRGSLRAAVEEIDKSVPIYQVSTLENYVSRSAAQPRFQTLLLSCFAAIALVLAAIGLYGLLSYMVAQRTLEIGLRMALGAKKADVLNMIVWRGLTLALIGLGAGLAISGMMTRVLSGMLYGVEPSDPMTFAGMTGVLLFVSLAASSIPAYRAAQLDPIETLREQ
ncbi:MAG TPA: ABC transporter permease [Bryobacteraceae bacterium]|jgi:predicted permease